jgi:hypothetical protein
MGRSTKKNLESKEHTHLFYYELPENDKKYEVEDGLYIPINIGVNKNEKLKLIFMIEGDISCTMDNALYLSTNLDDKRYLFDDIDTLKKEWNSKYKNLEKYSNLSNDSFFKNLVLFS